MSPPVIRWKRGEVDHHMRGYVGDVVRFTLHRHDPPNNSHFSIWVLFKGDVGAAYDGPGRERVGTFDTKRYAQQKANELVATDSLPPAAPRKLCSVCDAPVDEYGFYTSPAAHSRVHNHGPEDGPGLACNERLVGECLLGQAERPRAPDTRLLDIADEIIADYYDYIDNAGPRARELVKQYRGLRYYGRVDALQGAPNEEKPRVTQIAGPITPFKMPAPDDPNIVRYNANPDSLGGDPK